MELREVTSFGKWVSLIASLCKISYFPEKSLPVFLSEIKISMFDFLKMYNDDDEDDDYRIHVP